MLSRCDQDTLYYVCTTVYGIGVKLVSNWEQNILYTKRYKMLCRKKTFTLTGLKVPFLTRMRVFFRSKHNAKVDSHGSEF